MKRALVLSGGGGQGAYQVGALSFMLGVLKLRYDMVVGTSVGAINGAEVAQYPIGQEEAAAQSLYDMWLALKTKDVVDPHFLQPLALAWEPSTHTMEPLRKMLHERVDIEKMRASGRQYRALAVNIIDGCYRLYSEQDTKADLVDGMLASSSTPILHPNIRTYGADGALKEVLYDGGIRDTTPVSHAIKLGADEVDIILTQSSKLTDWKPKPDRVWNTGLRVFEIMFRELVEGDLRDVALYNALVEAKHPLAEGKRHVKVRLLRPADPLPIDAAKFDPEEIRDGIEIGRADAEAFGDWI